MTARNYTDAQTVASITGLAVGNITDSILNQAEMLIDSYTAVFVSSPLAPAYIGEELFEASRVAFTSTTCTITNITAVNGTYSRLAIEILTGTKAGTIIPVTASSNNQLIFDAITGLTGSEAIRIFQPGKYPMVKDENWLPTLCVKVIPQTIREAVAWQVQYLIDNPNGIFTTGGYQSESIGTSYSYNNGTASDKNSLVKYIAPKTISIINGLGYNIQTI